MANGRDGGVWALAGFLYQIVAMLSITARASRAADLPSNGRSDEVDALLALFNVGDNFQAQHEWFEDAMFTRDDQCVLVQFKYSSTDRKIGIRELRDIIKKLDESAGEATKQGDNVTACVLFTNRELTKRGETAKQLWDTEQKQQRPYKLRYHLSDSITDLEWNLEEFGHDYGLFPDEIKKGVDRLIGRTLRQTGNLLGSSIDKGVLVECFTGYCDTQLLTAAHLASSMHSQLDHFGIKVKVGQWNSMPVRREITSRIAKVVSERALVGLYGTGGCGKSMILWQMLSDLLGHGNACCMITHTRDLYSSWIADTVRRWRKIPAGICCDDRERAINRLLIANDNLGRQILWLALDGLDERPGVIGESPAGELVRWFGDRDRECQEKGIIPSTTLIVSCRRREILEDILTHQQYDHPGPYPPNILVDEFSIAEITDAARLSFPELYRRITARFGNQVRFQRAGFQTTSSFLIPLEYGSLDPQADPIDNEIWEALKHPAMWRALLSLPNEARREVIDGRQQAKHDLSLEFIKWFHWKVTLRVRRLNDQTNGSNQLVKRHESTKTMPETYMMKPSQ